MKPNVCINEIVRIYILYIYTRYLLYIFVCICHSPMLSLKTSRGMEASKPVTAAYLTVQVSAFGNDRQRTRSVQDGTRAFLPSYGRSPVCGSTGSPGITTGHTSAIYTRHPWLWHTEPYRTTSSAFGLECAGKLEQSLKDLHISATISMKVVDRLHKNAQSSKSKEQAFAEVAESLSLGLHLAHHLLPVQVRE